MSVIHYGFEILESVLSPKTRKILVSLGNAANKTTDTDNAELVSHYGFAYRPPKPTRAADGTSSAAQAVVLRSGDHDIVIASMDLRGLELYGELDRGEVCIYSAGEDGNGQARALFKKDGSVSLYTRKGNTKEGKGMMIGLDAQNGVCRVINDKGYGLIVDQDGVKITAGDSGLTLNASGTAKLVGKGAVQVDGKSVVLGSTATPATPCLFGPAGLAGVASTKVFIAPT